MRPRGRWMRGTWALAAGVVAALVIGCGAPPEPQPGERPPVAPPAVPEHVLRQAVQRTAAMADSIEDALRPVPLMRPGEEAALRRFDNATHLVRARALGVRPRDSAHVASLLAEGRLVRLADSTEHWVVRDLGYSRPLVTPDAHALLEEIGRRFQAALAEHGLPPLRLEITSALRTAESQAELRQRNPNAAGGVSTHEYGTTVDLAYSGYAAPADLPGLDLEEAPDAAPYLRALAAARIEAAANEKSRELQKILGEVLGELQSAGDVLVTLERQQPVYHLTVARRLADG